MKSKTRTALTKIASRNSTLRARSTRSRIYSCAIALINKQGYESTTMEDIARDARVARASVFNHFASKHDVLGEFLRNFTNEIIATTKASVSRGFTDRMRTLFAAAGAIAKDNRNVIAATASLAVGHGPLAPVDGEVDDALRSFLVAVVKDGQGSGEVRRELKAEFLGDFLLGLMTVTLHDWVNGGVGASLEAALNSRLEVLMAGAGADSKYLNSRR